jgi:catechol 2,3-dioxygenase-like lactoylglutathione lyase family enzyme
MSRSALARLQAMSLTTQITSVTVEVADQDRALAFYRDILGCEVRADVEVWPGARWLEVAPPGSDVGIALLTRASGLPLGVRYGTVNADGAHERLVGAGVQPHQDVLRTDYAPPMFTLADPDGNTVILIEDEEPAPHAG